MDVEGKHAKLLSMSHISCQRIFLPRRQPHSFNFMIAHVDTFVHLCTIIALALPARELAQPTRPRLRALVFVCITCTTLRSLSKSSAPSLQTSTSATVPLSTTLMLRSQDTRYSFPEFLQTEAINCSLASGAQQLI